MCLLRRLILTVLVVMLPTAAEAETGRNIMAIQSITTPTKG